MADIDYINSLDYNKLKPRIKDQVSAMTRVNDKLLASRKLRFQDIDVEAERKSGKLKPDEMFIPQHLIDMNIRREQAPYIQYISQSPRAVILHSLDTPPVNGDLLEKDVTTRLRYEGWQLPLFAITDGMQQNGYGIAEVIYDETKPGHVALENVVLSDFGYPADCRDIQSAELVTRSYYYTRTELLDLAADEKFDEACVKQIVEKTPNADSDAGQSDKDRSLYKVEKVMFRVAKVVYVAWSCHDTCDAWLAAPKTLFIGRRKPYSPEEVAAMTTESQVKGQPLHPTIVQVGKEDYEKDYPYVIFQYLVSENNVISQLRGRVLLDQDTQEAVTSLMSSFCTAHRRAAGFYVSKDTDDPNNSLTTDKNILFEQGAVINSKIKQFQLTAPDPDLVNAIQTIVAANQNETSQVNFAVSNRKDSRKTATEVSAASQQQQSLSTVQVVLFSEAVRSCYSLMFSIIQSRVLAGLIKDVSPDVLPLYSKRWQVRPAGDVDVVERQQLIQSMMTAWPVVQNTPMAQVFLADLISKMFPERAAFYLQAVQQAAQQAQSQQSQMMQQAMAVAKQVGDGVVQLSKHSEFFSDTGRIHAFPAIQAAAEKYQTLTKTLTGGQQ